ncbi:MAG: FAD-dependent oxidoreductase [Thioalkalivibrionaceae bacterium]
MADDAYATVDDVAIIGGGLAGLAAAHQLARNNRRVRIFEASAQWGGRARGLSPEPELDNGQHILTGACRDFLALTQACGIDESTLFVSERFAWRLRGPRRHVAFEQTLAEQADESALNADNAIHEKADNRFPSDLVERVVRDTMLGFERSRVWDWTPPRMTGAALLASLWGRLAPLSVGERFDAMIGLARMRRERPPVHLTVAQWLDARRQPAGLVELFWKPLCVSALNTDISDASAVIFAQILRESLGSDRDARFLIFRRPLAAGLIDPLTRALRERGVTLTERQRVTAISPARSLSQTFFRIDCARAPGPSYARTVIIALPPSSAARLLRQSAVIAEMQDEDRQHPGDCRAGGGDGSAAPNLTSHAKFLARSMTRSMVRASVQSRGQAMDRAEALRRRAECLERIAMRPIATLYLGFARGKDANRVHQLRPLIGLMHQPGHWLVRREFENLDKAITWLAVVISNPDSSLLRRRAADAVGEALTPVDDRSEQQPSQDDVGAWESDLRIREVLEPLRRTPLPTVDGESVFLPRPVACRLIVERHATVAATVELEAQRCAPLLDPVLWPGVALTGDYLVSGLPSTLESAVRSGIQSANLIHAALLGDRTANV